MKAGFTAGKLTLPFCSTTSSSLFENSFIRTKQDWLPEVHSNISKRCSMENESLNTEIVFWAQFYSAPLQSLRAIVKTGKKATSVS